MFYGNGHDDGIALNRMFVKEINNRLFYILFDNKYFFFPMDAGF